MLKEDLKSLSKTDITDILCCCLLIAGILYSPFLFTVALIFMVIRILFIGNGHENLQKLKNNILVTICLLSVYILNLAGMLWSSNIKEGLFELNHKLPFLILPLFFLVTKNIKDISLNIIIKFYVTAITV